jgi:small subunit ribosomal protein S4
MGDPKKNRKKYSKPSHPWQKLRIEEEKVIVKDYGIKNKKELWKHVSFLNSFKNVSKKLAGSSGPQVEKEKKDIMNRLIKYGLIKDNAKVEDVLGLELKDVLDRRIQTLVYKKNFARSIGQARQFIVHGHIKVGDVAMTIPSYLVPVGEEPSIGYVESSSFNDEMHPERIVISKPKKVKPEKKQERRSFDRKRRRRN